MEKAQSSPRVGTRAPRSTVSPPSGGDGLPVRLLRELSRGLSEIVHPAAGQILALDGLRAIAILLVIATHTSSEYLVAGGRSTWLARLPIVQGGWVGVDLFFVLSGFFIGNQLWREQQTGHVSVGRFILRRGLRIWPLYFVVLATVLVLRIGTGTGAPWPDAFFMANYFGERVIPGSWSLATEEQFYILVPTLVWLGLRRNWSLADFRYGLAALMTVECCIRGVTWAICAGLATKSPSLEISLLYMPFHTHCDGLLAGLLVSNLLTDASTRAVMSSSRVVWALPSAAVLAIMLRQAHHAIFGYFGLALVFGAAVATCAGGTGWWTKLLSGRALHVFARLSFGMYLNYRFILPLLAEPICRIQAPDSLRLVLLYLSVLGGSAFLSASTFVLVERPFLRWRHALLSRTGKSPSRRLV